MIKRLKRKLILALITLNILFAIIFFIGVVNFTNGTCVLNTGLKSVYENGIIILFSILSMMNIIYELSRI